MGVARVEVLQRGNFFLSYQSLFRGQYVYGLAEFASRDPWSSCRGISFLAFVFLVSSPSSTIMFPAGSS